MLSGSFLGSVGTGLFGQYMDYRYADRLGESQRSWQENMSNTAYQRSVADMRAAGLNPAVMFAGSGGPASTPSGAMGSVGSFAGHLASGKQVQMVDTELRHLDEQVTKTKTEADVNREVKEKVKSDAALARASTALAVAELPERQANAALYSSKAGPALKIVEKILGAVHPALGFGAGWLMRRGSGGTGVLRSEQSGRVIGRIKRK